MPLPREGLSATSGPSWAGRSWGLGVIIVMFWQPGTRLLQVATTKAWNPCHSPPQEIS